MSSSAWDQVKDLYANYLDTIAPLIALVEVRYGFFPTPMLNELRAFTTHIARIANNEGDLPQEEQVRRASRHIERIKLDLYKYLATWYRDEYETSFPQRYSNVALDTIVIDGERLMVHYHQLLSKANEMVEQAKTIEINGPAENSLNLYHDALGVYKRLYKLISDNKEHIIEAERLRDKRVQRSYIIGGAIGVGASLVAAGIIYLCTLAWSQFFSGQGTP